MRVISTVAAMAISASAFAATPKFIESLRGCFDVQYRFVENDNYEYKLPKKSDDKKVLEWVQFSKKGDGWNLQRYGVYSKDAAMKHWAEDWKEIEKGTFRQEVLSPSGKLRYTCEGKLVFNQIRCVSKDAPKPVNRDPDREDYEVLDRENTLQFLTNKWIHVQNNDKKTKAGKVVANEVGWVEYTKLEDKECGEAVRKYPHKDL